MTEYVELRTRSYFSLLDGASSPEGLVIHAAELGMSTLALVDTNNVYGAIEFVETARQQGIKPILGASLTLDSGHNLPLLVTDETGWANLCWLIPLCQNGYNNSAQKFRVELGAEKRTKQDVSKQWQVPANRGAAARHTATVHGSLQAPDRGSSGAVWVW